MKEQDRSGINFSASETSPLPEQGGLTVEHWKFIAEKLPRKYKIKKFAKAVLSGIVDEEDFDQYLGRRHWWELADYFHKHTVGNIPRLSVGDTSVYKTMAEEIMDFARMREEKTEATIDDKLARALRRSNRSDLAKSTFYEDRLMDRETGVFWSSFKRGWYYRRVSYPAKKTEEKPASLNHRHIRKIRYTRDWIVEQTVGARSLIGRFLLDPSTDIKKIKHKSPRSLVRLAMSQREDVARRTGLSWEKPIPKSA